MTIAPSPELDTEIEIAPIPALTVHQPWAALLAFGEKQYETRSWSSAYRGLIAIHAGKNRDGLQWLSYDRRDGSAGIIRNWMNADVEHAVTARTFGAVIGFGWLTAIYKTEHMRDYISDKERMFGDYSDRRFAWQLTNVYRLPEPVICNGHERIWKWTPTLAAWSFIENRVLEVDAEMEGAE